MKACQGSIGRVFVLRLEDGDPIPGCINQFAEANNIMVGHVVLLGGIGGGEVVVGPRRSSEMPPDPMLLPVEGAHEVLGVGLIAPDDTGKPELHIHASLGRSGRAVTGCLRPGVETWLVGEAVIYEIAGAQVSRKKDKASGFGLLEPVAGPGPDQERGT